MNKKLQEMSSIKNLTLAVIGHVEWVSFLSVDKLPQQGIISHGNNYKEEPAGGGAVAAVQMARLTNKKVHFFTALGNDSIGKKSFDRLNDLGLKVHAAWRDVPTRKGFSFVGPNSERAIIVFGERIQPQYSDPLPWEILKNLDGVFITAADSQTIKLSRKAKVVCATPRTKAKYLNEANIRLDALISSQLDPDEKIEANKISIEPKVEISTEGALGGQYRPGGRYESINLHGQEKDSYGCGDSFAAGVTAALAAKWEVKEAINLGAKCGAKCATFFGPY